MGRRSYNAMSAPAVHKQFPVHWGAPPRIQTRDLRPLPGGYGRGSSTLAGWIKRNLDADAAAEAAGKPRYHQSEKSENSARVDAYMDKVLARQKEEEIEQKKVEAREAADEALMSRGEGTYMKHDAEWYRKWQFRKEYTDNRNNRARGAYRSFATNPTMLRMQRQ